VNSNVQAELHPKIEEALNRDIGVDGFIFDIQSNNPEYYEENLEYLKEQLQAIYDFSKLYQVIVLSRGRELQSLVTLSYEKPAYRLLKSYHDTYGTKIQVDIAVAAALGYTENSFSRIIDTLNDSYITIVTGRNNNMVIIELDRMSLQETKQVKLSPTWRTDSID
jgi:hypothetical protein